MYLVQDKVKFRDRSDVYEIFDVTDNHPHLNGVYYQVRNTVTGSVVGYSFWVPEDDLEYIPETD